MVKTKVEAPPRNDAYTGMLIISLLAMIGACALLYMDYEQYDGKTPPKVAVPDVPGAKLEKAPPAGARPAPKPKEPEGEPKPPDPKPEEPKTPDMTGRAPAKPPEPVAVAPIELPSLPPAPMPAEAIRPTGGTAGVVIPEVPSIPMAPLPQPKPSLEDVQIPMIPLVPAPETKPATPEVTAPPMRKAPPLVTDPNAPPLNVGVFTPPK